MKNIDGVEYLKIGEVAEILDRSPQTVKIWYEWRDKQDKKTKKEFPFPEVRQDLDGRGTRYYKKDEIKLLQKFKDNLGYGDISDLTREKWGERGEEIKKRMEEKNE